MSQIMALWTDMRTSDKYKILILSGISLLLFLLTTVTRASEPLPAASRVVAPSSTKPLVLSDEVSKYGLGLHLDILEDPSGELTFEEVSSAEFTERFIPSLVEVPNYGFTDSVYWVRVTLDNQAQHTNEWLMELGFANIQYVDLYSPSQDGMGFDFRQTGSLRPISTRDVVYPHIVFTLNIPSQDIQTVYLRFQSEGSMTLPLTLWTKNAFIASSGQVLALDWLLFGGLIALLFYHLFMSFSLKEVTYLYFVILLGSIFAVVFEYLGYMSVYLLPDLYYLKPYYFPIFLDVLYISIIFFSDGFLHLKAQWLILHRLNLVLVAGWVVLILAVPFVSYDTLSRIVIAWELLTIAAIWVIGVLAWRKGARPVSFFMLAWLGMAASLFLVVLVRMAIIPSTQFTENLFQVGFIVMAVCWSFALAERINLMKSETEDANRQVTSSEFRMAQILEGFPLGVIVYGKDQKPLFVNQRTNEILGISVRSTNPANEEQVAFAEALKNFSFLVADSGKEYPLEEMPLYKALQGEEASVENIVGYIGDKQVPLEVWASPVRNESGEVETVVAVFQDITERRRTEAELAEYRKSLELQVEKRTAELSTVNEQLTHEITERKKLEQTLVQRIGWLTQFNKIHQAITGMIDLAQADEQASQLILKLLDAQAVVITRWGTWEEDLVIRGFSQTGETHTFPVELRWLFQIGTSLREEIKKGKFIQYTSDQIASLPGPLPHWFQEQGVRSLVFYPMIIRKVVVGVLGVASSGSGKVLTSQTEDVIGRMAYDLANLAQDAELFDQKRALLTMEERNRLARELHDSVAQGLYSISLFVDAIRMAIDSNRLDTVKQHLDELTDLSREAMADMRVLIFELRPPVLEKEGLVAALQTRLDSVEARAGFQTIFQSDGNIHLTKDKEGELYRIAQEALSNVIKHAHARKVLVRLSGDLGMVRLSIEDDGDGFNPELVEQAGGQGLRNIYERAVRIGAKCTFESAPGQGTKVTVEVNP